MARCFVACFLTPESARELLDCRPAVAEARPVPLENLHVTLLFAGSLSPAEADALAASCAGLGGRPLTAAVKRLGAFPRGPRARMLALELEADAQLSRWHRELRAAWPAAGDSGAFRPHVTLYRSRRPLLMPETDCAVSSVMLEVPCLYESLTLPAGVRYRPWHTDGAR